MWCSVDKTSDACLDLGCAAHGSPAMLSYAAETCHTPSETDSTGTEGTDATAVAKGLGPRIYIGGVSTAISQTMIRNHMSQFGKVVDVYFPRHHQTGQRQAFCFVTFTTQRAANTAVSKSKRSICGHQVGSIAHTTDRVTHYRTCPTGQDAPEHQADLLPNTAAAHAAAASMQQAINLANFAASQNSLAAITRPLTVLDTISELRPEGALVPQIMLGTLTPNPAEILASAQMSTYTPVGLHQHSDYIRHMMAAYLRALGPSTAYAVQPQQQIYPPPLHCEEALLWHHLQNL